MNFICTHCKLQSETHLTGKKNEDRSQELKMNFNVNNNMMLYINAIAPLEPLRNRSNVINRACPPYLPHKF